MNNYRPTLILLKLLTLSFVLLSSVSSALVISNNKELGLTVDTITKKSRKDWSCWETNPAAEPTIFSGSFCGVFDGLILTDVDEDYMGIVRATNTGLSALGRHVVGLNTKNDFHWLYGVEISYYKYDVPRAYQFELMDEEWNYVDIVYTSEENCGDKSCSLKAIIPAESRGKYYKTAKNLYARMVVLGTRKYDSLMLVNKLEALVYWAGAGPR